MIPRTFSQEGIAIATQVNVNQFVNLPVARLAESLARNEGKDGWSEKLILDGRNRGAIISTLPGMPGAPHLHPDFNEFWLEMGGQTAWQIGEYEPVIAEFGDLVIAPCGQRHDIYAVGEGPGRRLVVGFEDSNHELKGVASSRQLKSDDSLQPPNRIHTSFRYMLGATAPTQTGRKRFCWTSSTGLT